MTVDATALAAAVTGLAFFAGAFFARDLRAVVTAFVRDAFFRRFAPPFVVLFAIDSSFSPHSTHVGAALAFPGIPTGIVVSDTHPIVGNMSATLFEGKDLRVLGWGDAEHANALVDRAASCRR